MTPSIYKISISCTQLGCFCHLSHTAISLSHSTLPLMMLPMHANVDLKNAWQAMGMHA